MRLGFGKPHELHRAEADLVGVELEEDLCGPIVKLGGYLGHWVNLCADDSRLGGHCFTPSMFLRRHGNDARRGASNVLHRATTSRPHARSRRKGQMKGHL